MSTDSIVLWMSAVKPITAVAVAKAWEQGAIDLDAPVARYVPEFAENGKEAVTIEHLLTHTAGIPKYFVPWSMEHDEAMRNICALELEDGWIPGDRAGYHPSSAWQMLGEIIQRVTGREYGAYLREQVFGPIGMHDSWIGIPPDVIEAYGERIAITFAGKPGQLRPTNHRPHHVAQMRPGANGRGPIRELGRFYELLLAGGEDLLKPDTVETFRGLTRQGMFDETFQYQMDWGLGFMRNSGPDAPYSFGTHASPETFGHGGMESTMAFCDPVHRLVAAWACIGMPGEDAHQIRNRAINDAIYEDLNLSRAER
jgi:CubicO group peptidase (beta-lactamase class C family)